jgi:hypothetical protein
VRSRAEKRPAVRAFFQVRLHNRQRLFGPAKFVVERKQADLGEEGFPELAEKACPRGGGRYSSTTRPARAAASSWLAASASASSARWSTNALGVMGSGGDAIEVCANQIAGRDLTLGYEANQDHRRLRQHGGRTFVP